MIVVSGISKRFKLYSRPSDRLKEIFLRRPFHTTYQALENVSFSVADGEALGIIGPNGAGKSTLLKILTGVLLPDSGVISVTGKVTGLLELGTGFNPEMTGRQNIYMNGLLLGMNREEIQRKEETIVDFAELGEFIDEPIKTYSSGMVMRLGFAVAYNAEPACFVVDEALSVGDAYFSQKCMRAIRTFQEKGGSIVFVSHDMNAIKVLCDSAILLSKGKTLESGEPEDVVNSYNRLLSLMKDKAGRIQLERTGKKAVYGNMDAEITNVRVEGHDSQSNVVCSGEETSVIVEFESKKEIPSLTVGIMIRDKFGQDIFGTNTFLNDIQISCLPGKRYECSFVFSMDLAPGVYTITAALHTERSHIECCYNWKDNVTSFQILGGKGSEFAGLVRLRSSIEWRVL
jgi:lipopolysaccharide transport system ATP-binding protein